jgi:hypothetical protein
MYLNLWSILIGSGKSTGICLSDNCYNLCTRPISRTLTLSSLLLSSPLSLCLHPSFVCLPLHYFPLYTAIHSERGNYERRLFISSGKLIKGRPIQIPDTFSTSTPILSFGLLRIHIHITTYRAKVARVGDFFGGWWRETRRRKKEAEQAGKEVSVVEKGGKGERQNK